MGEQINALGLALRAQIDAKLAIHGAMDLFGALEGEGHALNVHGRNRIGQDASQQRVKLKLALAQHFERSGIRARNAVVLRIDRDNKSTLCFLRHLLPELDKRFIQRACRRLVVKLPRCPLGRRRARDARNKRHGKRGGGAR